MTTNGKSEGSYTRGPSFGLGPVVPGWLRHNVEYVLVRETQVSNWTVQA